MTSPETLPLPRVGLIRIDLRIVWTDEGEILLFDMYIRDTWIGSRRLLSHIETEFEGADIRIDFSDSV